MPSVQKQNAVCLGDKCWKDPRCTKTESGLFGRQMMEGSPVCKHRIRFVWATNVEGSLVYKHRIRFVWATNCKEHTMYI